MSNTTINSRGADKHTYVANEIRRRIANGEFSPGSQLPQRSELVNVYQVSKVTLQRVMNTLIADGFIDTTRNKGSFVVERPPHLSRYALAFQGVPGQMGWTSFWMALVNEAAWRERKEKISIPIFYGIDGHTDTSDYQKLLSDVEEHRLAGIVYVSAPPRVPDLSIIHNTNIPGVTVQIVPSDGVPCVTIDYHSFIIRALKHLHKRGRRRVAFVSAPDFAQNMKDFMFQQATNLGFEVRPYWNQGIGLENSSMAQNCIHLMMNATQTERPDALIITDDNLTEAATTGLLAAGVKVPTEVEVVGHANFPWKTPCVVETRRLGYDVRPILTECLRSIDEQRRGVPAPTLIRMPALFEEELAA